MYIYVGMCVWDIYIYKYTYVCVQCKRGCIILCSKPTQGCTYIHQKHAKTMPDTDMCSFFKTESPALVEQIHSLQTPRSGCYHSSVFVCLIPNCSKKILPPPSFGGSAPQSFCLHSFKFLSLASPLNSRSSMDKKYIKTY